MKYFLLIGFMIMGLGVKAEKYYDFNATCQQAYHELISLKIESGKALIENEKQAHPDNLIPYFLDNYADLFPLFFNEDIKEFDKKLPLKEARLTAMKLGPQDSPWYLFTQAMMQMQWSAVHIKFGEKWAAGWSIKAAFGLMKENQKLFPTFLPSRLISGPLQAAAGTIPQGYQWLSGMLGIKGSIIIGMGDLTTLINSKDQTASIFKDEATFYYCYLKFYIENKPAEAMVIIKGLDVINNHLFAFMGANLSLNFQKSALAQQYVLQRNVSGEYMYTPMWDFELGYAKLYHLEPDANVYIERFLNTFKGKFYIKDALQKLAWYYWLQGNTAKYNQCLAQMKTRGGTETDADKKALKEASSGNLPNTTLLKARLLSDGGYYAEAFQLLAGKSVADFSRDEDKVEFAYRAARIYEDLGKYDEAIQAYLGCIKIGKQRTEYYAARSALQVGMIYEQKKNNKSLAIAFYQECLDMQNHDFKNSLDQKAKAGIARCKGQ
jgi:hypothetical protein